MKLISKLFTALLGVVLAVGFASAVQAKGNAVEYNIPLAKANTITKVALACARREKLKPMGIAILDSGGHLIKFEREDKATFFRFDIATGKAYGALGLHMDTAKYVGLAEKRPAFFGTLTALTGGRAVPSPGGVVVRNTDGHVVGAVGMTGDKGARDEACAKEGLKAAGY